MINVTEATTSELVAFWNENAPQFGAKPVNRFATRGDAERRVRELIDNIEAHAEEEVTPPEEEVMPPDDEPVSDARSAGVHRSWQDPEVRAARSQRNAVLVDGERYQSVGAAFRALNLKYSERIRFRKQLKKERTAEAYGYSWALID